ncbi:anthrone oxygenase family protein [Hyphomicrobium sp.]|uniref:anthrone oxygenase family protein n=1 Tax=Hyphomicrobium sp. TaxID=82 RepID=UPI0025BCC210|nr:anthrone oxygenase family protein [Hyphomicrobium sp.]MCC7251539.1 DUF1772 domain-containing protein [Hyphomicrobium sp.]
MEPLLEALTWISALGAALIAGVFFAFSTFVMTALGHRPPAEGIAAMQEINVVVVRSGFIAVFFASAIASALLALFALLRWDHDPRAIYWLAGAILYVIGTFALTIACNVPLNDELAAVDPASAQGAGVWSRYLADWTWWNTVRTAASLIATAAFILALHAPAP